MINSMFKNPFSFEGRIRRLEYGLSYLIYMIVIIAISFTLEAFAIGEQGPMLSLIMLGAIIPLAWFLIAQRAKRCHDLGNSGWWQLIPFYGLWLLFAEGQVGINEYGLNPKGIGNNDDVNEFASHLS